MVNLFYGNSAAVVRMNHYAKALALSNVNVYFLSPETLDVTKKWIEVEPHIFTLSKNSVKRRKGHNPFYILSLVHKIKQHLKTIKGDVVLLNYPTTRSLFLDIFLLLYCRKFPIFCEVNEVRRYASDSKGSIRDHFYWTILEKTYKYYKGVVFISRNIQNYYASKVQKSIIIPILSNCDHAFSVTNGLDTLDFVFIGTVSFPKENLEELLEGFYLFYKNHPKAQLSLYGNISSVNMAKLNKFIKDKGTEYHIRYIGEIHHSEVEKILANAGALVLPRSNNKQNYYGFSTKLSEYAVSGTPIIMTNTGVVTDFFHDRVNCLMCEGYSRFSFMQKFEELSSMSNYEKQELAKNAYLVAKNKFDYRLYSKELNDFLFVNK